MSFTANRIFFLGMYGNGGRTVELPQLYYNTCRVHTFMLTTLYNGPELDFSGFSRF